MKIRFLTNFSGFCYLFSLVYVIFYFTYMPAVPATLPAFIVYLGFAILAGALSQVLHGISNRIAKIEEKLQIKAEGSRPE